MSFAELSENSFPIRKLGELRKIRGEVTEYYKDQRMISGGVNMFEDTCDVLELTLKNLHEERIENREMLPPIKKNL